MKRPGAMLTFFSVVTLSLTGCGPSGGYGKYDNGLDDDQRDSSFEREYAEVPAEQMTPPWKHSIPEPTYEEEPYWSCSFDPTYNYDWHDDAWCTNGHESHRPYLLEYDDFIEEWEFQEAMREYENSLNSF